MPAQCVRLDEGYNNNTMDYFEHETTQARLYDREVTAFLLRYILRYRSYLFAGIILVALITGVSIVAPYCSKIILDRYVIKTGYVVSLKTCEKTAKQPDMKRSAFLEKKLRSGIVLEAGRYFLLKAQLRFFSEQEITAFRQQGVFSSRQYILVESLKEADGELIRKIDALVKQNTAIRYADDIAVIAEESYNQLPLIDIMKLRSRDIYIVTLIVLGLIILFAIQFVAAYYQNLTLMKLSQYSMRDLRVELFARILSYEVNYFDTNPLGRLVNRITNDIEVLNEMFSSVLVSLFQDILLLTGIAVIMFREDVYLASAVAVTFPALIFITWLFRIKSAEKYRKIREITARLNAFLSETISGIRIIQLFVAEVKNLSKFHKVNMELYRENMGQMYVFSIFRPLIDFIKWFCVASVLYFGAQGIVHHAISWGVIVLFMQYIASFFDPISDLSEKFDIMISANAAGEKILTVVHAGGRRERRVINEEGNQRVCRDDLTQKSAVSPHQQRFSGAVEFRNVWFGYKKDEWVLKDLCLQVQPRQTIAIVGETGAGKSTIISLLSRLYDIQKGDITIDGMHIKDIPYELLRRNIAIVMQDVFLFSRTVRENIILNAPYDEERFRFVCAITHADQFIKQLPHGDQEPVMERGVTFSSGERQLISFARALYFDPSILVLDEATANIDSETEKLIQDAISHLIENRTSILIAHRLSTVRNADQIVVLEKGRIVETGKHAELIRRRGIYYNLYRLQFQEH